MLSTKDMKLVQRARDRVRETLARQRSAEDWAALVADLEARQPAAEARVAELHAARKDAILAAELGESGSRETVVALDAEIAAAERGQADIAAALDGARARHAHAIEAEQEAERQAGLQEAARLREQGRALADEADVLIARGLDLARQVRDAMRAAHRLESRHTGEDAPGDRSDEHALTGILSAVKQAGFSAAAADWLAAAGDPRRIRERLRQD